MVEVKAMTVIVAGPFSSHFFCKIRKSIHIICTCTYLRLNNPMIKVE